MFRFLLRFLMNEKLIERLSESYPIRRAAKWVVYFIRRGKTIQEDNIGKITEDNFKGLAEKIVKSLKDAKENLEKQAKK